MIFYRWHDVSCLIVDCSKRDKRVLQDCGLYTVDNHTFPETDQQGRDMSKSFFLSCRAVSPLWEPGKQSRLSWSWRGAKTRHCRRASGSRMNGTVLANIRRLTWEPWMYAASSSRLRNLATTAANVVLEVKKYTPSRQSSVNKVDPADQCTFIKKVQNEPA